MDDRRERNVGLSVLAVGLATVVLAVLLFGLTADSGEADWTSIVTAISGVVMALAGLYIVARNQGTGGTPHAAS